MDEYLSELYKVLPGPNKLLERPKKCLRDLLGYKEIKKTSFLPFVNERDKMGHIVESVSIVNKIVEEKGKEEGCIQKHS